MGPLNLAFAHLYLHTVQSCLGISMSCKGRIVYQGSSVGGTKLEGGNQTKMINSLHNGPNPKPDYCQLGEVSLQGLC